MLDKLIIT